MADLTYEDFKRRINIQDLLVDAGYQLNRRDGLRYPSYIKTGSDGKRVRGDKFIVTGNGLCCFQPPEQKNYNVISFIKEHPQLFAEYSPGMKSDRLVNLVCNRLLHHPITERPSAVAEKLHSQRVFDISRYEQLHFKLEDWESQKVFYPYFKYRGINLDTQKVFRNNFFIALREGDNGKRYANLSFPMQKPSNLGTFVGLEERSKANAEGKTFYKGMAAGSNATEGLWIANLSGEPLSTAQDVYWFESAYDAMAYYQQKKEQLQDTIGGYGQMQSEGCYGSDEELREYNAELAALMNSVFVSTGGNPSIHQFNGMLAETGQAGHHLCFDRDRAGRMFALNFAFANAGKTVQTRLEKDGTLHITDLSDNQRQHHVNLEDFHFERTLEELGIGEQLKRHGLTDYIHSLRNEEDIFSGEVDLLPHPLLKDYADYESLAEELHSSGQSGLVCKEELEELKEKAQNAACLYRQSLDKAVQDYRSQPGRTIYEPCDERYKDWNDQLLGKKTVCAENMETADEHRHHEQEERGKETVSEEEKEAEEMEQEEDNRYHFHR